MASRIIKTFCPACGCKLLLRAGWVRDGIATHNREVCRPDIAEVTSSVAAYGALLQRLAQRQAAGNV